LRQFAWRKEFDGLPLEMQNISGLIPYLKVHRMVEAGYLQAEDIDSLGPISTGHRPGRTDEKKRIILLTGGMVTEDIMWAYVVYAAAKEKRIGQELTLWNEPHWS
jgi:hypothetical protein